MSLWNPKSWFGRKDNPVGQAITGFMVGRPVWSQVDYATLSNEGYRKNVYVYACVQKIAMACAGIRPQLWRIGRGGNRTEVVDPQHPINKLLKRPNPRQGYRRFVENEVANLQLSGNTFIAKAGPTNGPPTELYVLRSDRTKVVIGDVKDPVGGYQYYGLTGIVDLPRDIILHQKTFNPLDDFYGMAPLEAGARSLDQNNSSRAWNVALLQNGARPSGAIISKNFIPDEAYKRLNERFLEKSGPLNAGTPLVLEGQEIGWQELGLTPIDMAWLEGTKMSAREIALTFGVPPEIVGDSANKTYANYGESRLAFTEETILPYMDWRMDEYNGWLVPLFGEGYELGYDKDSIEVLREKRAVYITATSLGWNAGFIKRNEARRMVDLEDDADPELGEAYKTSAAPVAEPTDPENEDPKQNEDKKPKQDDVVKAFPRNPDRTKFLNLDSKHKKTLHQKKMDKTRDQYIAKMKAKVVGVFDDEMYDVVKAARGAASPERALVRAVDAVTTERWVKLFDTIYMQVGFVFAKQVWHNLKSQVGPSKMKADDDVQTIWEDAVQAWLDEYGATKIGGIAETTQDKIRSLIKDDMEQGKSVGEIADDLEDLYSDEFSASRAEMVARTETISASNLGSQEAAKATGLNLEKEWIATDDDRTRDDHADADGQRVAMDDPYEVGGSELMFPGDPSLGADASQTINCRCTEGYYSVGGDEEDS